MYNLQIVRLILVKRYKILYGNPFGRASPKNGGGTPLTSSTKEIFEFTVFFDEHTLAVANANHDASNQEVKKRKRPRNPRTRRDHPAQEKRSSQCQDAAKNPRGRAGAEPKQRNIPPCARRPWSRVRSEQGRADAQMVPFLCAPLQPPPPPPPPPPQGGGTAACGRGGGLARAAE
jgi:hypothetical protein